MHITHTTSSWRSWRRLTAISSALLAGLIALTLSAVPAQADMVDDSYISSVSFDTSSNALGATATTNITFTNSEVLPSGSDIWFDVNSSTGCQAPDWSNCAPDFSSASASGIAATLTNKNKGNFSMNLESDLAVGSHTVTLTNVVNPTQAASIRARVSASASDEQVLLGSGFKPDNWYTTSSTNAEDIGTVVVHGTVSLPTGGVFTDGWSNIHNADWSKNGGAQIDEKGDYAVFADYDTWPSDTYTIEVFPQQGSGYINTTATFSYTGTPVTKNITLLPAEYYLTGKVVYGAEETSTVSAEPGDAVADARVIFNKEGGGGSFSAVTDLSGIFSVPVEGPSAVGGIIPQYSIFIEPNADRRDAAAMALIDWQFSQREGGQKFSITEKGSKNVGTFEVDPTNAFISGTVSAPNASYGNMYAHLSFRRADATPGQPGTEWWSYAEGGTFNMNLIAGVYKVTISPDINRNSALASLFYSATVTVVEGVNDPLNFVMDALTSSVNFTVTNENDVPLKNIDTNVSTEGYWAGTRTNASGQSTLYIPSGEQSEAHVWSDDYISQTESQRFKLAEGESKNITFVMQAPDAFININVLDPDGNPADVFGHASCETNNHTKHFGKQVQGGVATVPVAVDSFGTFTGTCNVWLPDNGQYGTTGAVDVTVADEETIEVPIQLTLRDATIRVFVKNLATGKKIQPQNNASVSLWNQTSWYDRQLETNPVEIQVPSGLKFSGGVWCQDCGLIFIWSMNTKTVKSSADKIKNLVLNVLKQDGFLTATVQGPDGNPLSHGGVHCNNGEYVDLALDTVAENTIIETSKALVGGTAVVPLISGHNYNCVVGVPPEYTEWIAPPEQKIKFPSANKPPEDITFKLLEANARITGTVDIADGVTSVSAVSDIDHIWCWAWGEEGGNSWYETTPGGKVQLNAIAGDPWVVGCDAQDYESETWYGSEPVEITPDLGENIVNITLDHFSWVPYDSFSQTIDASQSTVITYYDGTILTIPAGTLAASGNMTIMIEQENQIVPNKNDHPFFPPLDFEAFDENGQLIETFNGNVTIEISYTNQDLREAGITENALSGKFKDENSNTWKMPDNMVHDKANNKVIITTNHFTEFGVMYNSSLATVKKPKQPRSLRANKITDSSAVLKWKKPKNASMNASVAKYKVQVRQPKQKKTKSWVQFKSVRRVKKKVTELQASTQYQFRVRAMNTAGNSKFSRWQQFKTTAPE